MNDASANSIFVALLFILRCLVPLAILFGVSYLLRKMGLVAMESPEPPDDGEEGDGAATGEVAMQDEPLKDESDSSEANPNETPSVENNKES